ncbi:MAG: hypothetical protein ACJAVI_001980 [Candidatus Azotimanducaceae bacterium]|jgi:hypothetical protein
MRYTNERLRIIARHRDEKSRIVDSKARAPRNSNGVDDYFDATPVDVVTQLSPLENSILQALPTLIDKVRDVLVTTEKIDEHLYRKLTTAIDRLDSSLVEVQVYVEPTQL